MYYEMNILDEIKHLSDIGYCDKQVIHELLENQCIFKESERWYTEQELEDACLESFNEGYQEASD